LPISCWFQNQTVFIEYGWSDWQLTCGQALAFTRQSLFHHSKIAILKIIVLKRKHQPNIIDSSIIKEKKDNRKLIIN
jgi:hypothetical protein